MNDNPVIGRLAALLTVLAERATHSASAPSGVPEPIHWPSLTSQEAETEWDALRRWVEQLRVRFPNAVRLPECWWQHNDLVEILSALRDHERLCYAPSSSAGPVDWHRALRDAEARMDVWTKRFTCSVPGRGHDVPEPSDAKPSGWEDFVTSDVNRRRQKAETADQ